MVLSFCPDDILNAVLPQELVEGKPSGFAAVGHVGKSEFSKHRTYPLMSLLPKRT